MAYLPNRLTRPHLLRLRMSATIDIDQINTKLTSHSPGRGWEESTLAGIALGFFVAFVLDIVLPLLTRALGRLPIDILGRPSRRRAHGPSVHPRTTLAAMLQAIRPVALLPARWSMVGPSPHWSGPTASGGRSVLPRPPREGPQPLQGSV